MMNGGPSSPCPDSVDFRRAASRGPSEQAQQKAQQSAAAMPCQPLTSVEETNEKTPENRGSVDYGQPVSTGVNSGVWAIQGSNLRPPACHAGALAN